jgi:hypothetical protein
MKLTIAVTDACIFIDLFDLDLMASLGNSNCIFRNNKQLSEVIAKRLKIWSL